MSEIIQNIIAAGIGLENIGISAENATAHFIGFMGEMSVGRNKRKDEILSDWRKSFSMPRKMKKRVRKELLLDIYAGPAQVWEF